MESKRGSDGPGRGLFSPPTQEGERSRLPWVLAGLTVALVLAALLLVSRRHPAAARTVLPSAPYAASLSFSSPVMSESTSLSGGKSTFLDGTVRNTGSSTVTAATVQVLFANSEGLPPQVETLPLAVVRTREPYVDTQPLAAAALAPGAEREFRLIFEDIGANWNQQLPEIRVVAVSLH